MTLRKVALCARVSSCGEMPITNVRVHTEFIRLEFDLFCSGERYSGWVGVAVSLGGEHWSACVAMCRGRMYLYLDTNIPPSYKICC